MTDAKRPLPYLIARIAHDGRPWPDDGTFDKIAASKGAILGDDGWFTRGRRRGRWYLDVSLANYAPIIVARERLNDIRALEDLRYRAQVHVERVLEPLYQKSIARLRAADDPRIVRGDRIMRIEFTKDHVYSSESFPTEREIKAPENAGIVDRISAIPTPDHEDFKAGENWLFHQRGIHAGLFRVGRAEAALRKALDLYRLKHHPKEMRLHSDRRPTFVFIINGRYYPIGREEYQKNIVIWPQLSDIVVNLDKENTRGEDQSSGRASARGSGDARSSVLAKPEER